MYSMRGNAMGQSSDHSVSAELSKVAPVKIPQNTGSGLWGIPVGSSDASLFSSSLPVLPHAKLNFLDANHGMRSIDDISSKLSKLHKEVGDKDPIEEMETHAIGSLLPDDEDELLAGIMDDFDLSELPSQIEELEEYDLFGGMEMDHDPTDSLSIGMAKASLSDGYMANGNGNGQYGLPNGVGAVAGEHPYGEHPSRTLFVRNINSNVEDSELRSLFEDNPSDKDINQGTLVVFNLDPSVSNEELRHIFGAYGEVKEIRETPHKKHHKFVEYYDVRSADAALRSLNRSDIAGKRIKLEPSRPGGARRNLMQQLTQELDQDESRGYRTHVGSPITNSPPGILEHSSGILPNMSPTSTAPGVSTMNGPQFLWGSQAPYPEHSHSSAWSTPSMVHSFSSSGQGQGFPYPNRHGSFLVSSRQNHHHVGSAPSGIPFERHFGFVPESPESSFMNPVSFGGMGFSRNEGSYMMNVGARAAMTSGMPISGNVSENGSPNFRMMSPQMLSPMFLGGNQYPGPGSSGIDVLIERGRSRRVENNGNQVDSKQQYQLDLEKIVSGEDTRTTLMIKNIPNKYTSKMLLAAIDEHHRGTYDFLYLPIDFKNKCNVGYAFINMVSPSHIIPFYQAFNGKKWEKFNSEKVASLAYARIQGKAALVTHFQNSSLMNEDKRCRPILFHSEGPEAVDQIFQEAFPPLNVNVRARPQDGISLGDSPEIVKKSNFEVQVGRSSGYE
ncbi:Protein MEI2-like 2 [Acorus gramineus]|uniref:Protein MEI2-like 2 n=1 Tax=Acorus gramineus TaxID=55184 RepID=A0AAV9BKE9_ACOGR|nr:Protein MEI2-like 2 [Acorus gramineus]